MLIGTLRIDLLIRESRSLKARRRIVNSLKDRIRGRYNVSVADVGDQNLWQRAVLVVAVVSNDGRFANEVLSKVLGLIDSEPRVEIISQTMDYL
ncbi:DUF503 domain-containing protein [bacterium]|nr:DUF503 domain-containing protein [bacterium]